MGFKHNRTRAPFYVVDWARSYEIMLTMQAKT